MTAADFFGGDTLSAAALQTLLQARQEIAVIDVREEIPFSTAHLFICACLPLSRLELMSAYALPCLATPICCVDDGEGLAAQAVDRLRALGYRRVVRLEGGINAWRGAGFPLYSGVHVPSKAFAEAVEHHYNTESIDAEDLDATVRSGAPVLILDGRSLEEYLSNSIPGAYSVPNGELVLRIHDLAPSPDTLVVVNCGGRTRSIIGAQTLVDLGLPNKTVALRNGTMAWHLANLPILTDQNRALPPLTSDARAKAVAGAKAVADDVGIRQITAAELTRWQTESDRRALYLLDVRTPAEYVLGHMPGAICAPGGQLLQETEVFVPTFRARIVLVDDGASGRAAMTGSWLVRMGWGEVAVFVPAPDDIYVAGPTPPAARGLTTLVESESDLIDPAAALARCESGDAVIVDVGTSKSHKTVHIAGAWFAIRARLHQNQSRLPQGKMLILTSEDGILARLAAAELRRLEQAAVALRGGTAAWIAAGLPVEAGLVLTIDEADDIWYAPRHRDGDREAAMREYLAWEIALVEQIGGDPDVPFALARST